MHSEILRFVDTIHRDKQIDKEIIFTGIEMALISAAQKKFGTTDGITVTIDRVSGSIHATVDDEPLSPVDLGRIAALSGKQVLFQKIREAERDVIYQEYKPKIGQLLTGTVQSKKPGGVLILSLSGAEGFLPRSEQSPAETFNEGDRIKVVLSEVNLLPNRIQLLCSRSSPEIVRRLFELEIPEVADYVVEVKAIAREAGYRTKIAVTTYDPNVDCVGACVGVKGSRIRNIVDELFGEKIDIVRWNDSIEILIVEALRPAVIASLDLDFDAKTTAVYVTEDQQSLAIGRRGQNVRLASKLTGWDLKITPVSEEDLQKMREEGMESLADGLFTEGMAGETRASSAASPALDRLFTGSAESAARSSETPPSGAPERKIAGARATALEALFKSEAADADEGDRAGSSASSEAGAQPETDDEVPAVGEDTTDDVSLATDPTLAADLSSPGETLSEDSLIGEPVIADVGVGEGIEEVRAADLREAERKDAINEKIMVPPSDELAFHLEQLPGVGSVTADRMREAGLDSRVKILEAGLDSLSNVEGISESRARQILDYLMTT